MYVIFKSINYEIIFVLNIPQYTFYCTSHSTNYKINDFVAVVKRKPLFNDRPTEIQELTYIIKEDLKAINEQLARLQGISKRQNISHQKNGHKHLLSHSNSVVVSLQSKLATMSNEFKQVLDTRTQVSGDLFTIVLLEISRITLTFFFQNLKQAKDRRDHFSESVASSSSAQSSAPFRQENTSLLLSDDHVYGQDEASASTSLLPVQSQTQMLMYDHTVGNMFLKIEFVWCYLCDYFY